MADVLFVDEDDDRDIAESVDLALEIEQAIAGLKATTVIYALCWVLASLVCQCADEKRITTQKSIEMIARQIATCVARLRERAPSSHIH